MDSYRLQTNRKNVFNGLYTKKVELGLESLASAESITNLLIENVGKHITDVKLRAMTRPAALVCSKEE